MAAPVSAAPPDRKDPLWLSPPPGVPTLSLNNGVEIPQLGFGVFQIKPEDTVKATTSALEIGYRHIDTAQMYGNEREVGLAVRESGIAREDVFVTSKLNNNRLERDDVLRSFDQSLADLGFDYLDLFLIHWPLPGVADYVARWKAMEEIYASGRAKAIGVSNFHPTHLRKVLAEGEITPAVNQIEVSPFLVQDERPRFRRRPRDRDRGVVADRPRQGHRRSGHRRDRRADRPQPRPGDAALAHPAR